VEFDQLTRINSPLSKALQWAVAALIAAWLLFVTVRSFLGADFLLGFANLFVC
jgi:hypothetical protein